MTPHDEHKLYLRDRRAWAQYVAPKWARTLAKGKTGFTHRSIWEQAVTYARSHSSLDKQPGRAAHIYKDIVGDWPPNQWRFEETANVPMSHEVLNKIKSRAIAFAKGRAKSA